MIGVGAATDRARPVAPGLFTWPSTAPALLGSRCCDCGTVTFPKRRSCPKCTSTEVESHELARHGTLWSWTVQRFEPKPPYRGPDVFTPFGVGYVKLGDEVIVEARLTCADSDRLAIGSPMRLTLEPVATDPDGTSVLTYAFAIAGTDNTEDEVSAT